MQFGHGIVHFPIDPAECPLIIQTMTRENRLGEARVARIVLENLVKTFGGGVTAVAGVSLEIQDGEFMIFVGPSGCGKNDDPEHDLRS